MAGNVNVKVSADSSGVKTGLAQAQEQINAFKESASDSFAEVGKSFAGMFAAAAIVEGLKSIFEQFARIGQLSKQAGESAEDFQRVAQVADKAGVDMEMLSKSVKNVTVAAVEAMEGSKELAEAFDDLGLNAKDFVDLPLEEKLLALSDAYNSSASNAIKVEAINKLLSKGGKELIPVLEEGSAAIKEQFAAANVASNQTVEDIEKAEETWKGFWDKIKVFGAEAIDTVIHLGQAFGVLGKIVGAFFSNLKHGWKAAAQAAQAATQEANKKLFQDPADAQAKAEEDRKNNRGKTEQGEAKRQLAEQQAEDEKKSNKEIAELQAENDKKKEDARLRHLTLAQRELDLQRQIAAIDKEQAFKNANKEDYLKADNKRLDLAKELESVQDDLRKSSVAKEKEAAKEKARAQLDAEKQKLTEGESLLKSMEEKYKPITIDSLKAVGGNLARVNYNAVVPRQNAEKEAIEHQKKAVEELKKIVKNTENIKPPVIYTANDGSFGSE